MIAKAQPFAINPELRDKAREVYCLLLKAFGLPVWKQPESPLDELISTILSQNTNDTNRAAAFTSLKRAFPTWAQVRDVAPEAVIAAIRTAGLANQKGPRIQAVLRDITAERGNLDLAFLRDLPAEDTRCWLLHFKGVGPKTAAIVMQFTLGHPAFPVDTHIYRVSGRIGLRPSNMSVEEAHRHLERLFKPAEYGAGHLNLIRLGREICHPRKPECERCPLNSRCTYYHLFFLTNRSG